ncbi:hypothetical protein BN2475_430023 [Paraburkholderia ribeironis]|uniref:Uncharacterized protein n=2 Tax=Paraburkholderia ribeironis TaxID=1247936 RepID=A0A1N7S808_9BURK|nr:hypothetical protein BN2475_430023 [Paraburkholderia ribeironis]
MRPFCIQSDEIIYRISYAQDTAPQSAQYRAALVSRFIGLSGQIPLISHWPPALRDLADGLTFDWAPAEPHHNIISNAGKRATLIYLGDEPRDSDVAAVGNKVRQSLVGKPTVDRCCVVFRRNGQLKTWSHPDSTRFDRPQSDSPTSITGA